MSQQSKFLQALSEEVQAIPPIWFMRQAGRYLPEYRQLREQAGSFLDLCFNSDLASEVTLQPVRRFDLDAAILFADILLIPHALGQKLSFEAGEGPILDPVISAKDIDLFRTRDVLGPLEAVFETVSKTKAALDEDKALIGFAGAPWTVATYMLAGRSTKDPASLRLRYYQDKEFIIALMDLLVEKTITYLIAQIDAGADAVQLFDTWASGLPWPVLDAVSVGPISKIASAIKKARPGIPIIMFPKGVGEKAGEYAMLPECDGFGIDYAMDPSWARAHLSGHTVVQGGLDPLVVIEGGETMKNAASVYMKLFHDVPHIFNLGHGFTPETPPEHVGELVKFVRGQS
ncbi:MAG: uroporphyrinogen decarboxylase [Hyphococcus sp.]|nr:MAG: uroporphyrinogen decarboxylase [Marinicaulis sp.]